MKRSLRPLLVVLLLSFGASAQEGEPAPPGLPEITLRGAVYDANGAVVVSGTKIVARAPDGKAYETGNDDEGIYSLRLPLGVYTVEVGAPGFCPAQVKEFRAVNATHGRMNLDFVLEVAPTDTPCARRMKTNKGSGKKAEKKFITITQ